MLLRNPCAAERTPCPAALPGGMQPGAEGGTGAVPQRLNPQKGLHPQGMQRGWAAQEAYAVRLGL